MVILMGKSQLAAPHSVSKVRGHTLQCSHQPAALLEGGSSHGIYQKDSRWRGLPEALQKVHERWHKRVQTGEPEGDK